MSQEVSRSLSSGFAPTGSRQSRRIFTFTLMVCTPMEQEEIKRRIIELQIEHRDLDEAIGRLSDQYGVDDLALRRMKKRKLQIKDSMSRLEMGLVPDIPA
jgi:hypothetical protein